MKQLLQFYIFLKMFFGMRVRASFLVKAYGHKAIGIASKYRRVHFDINSDELDYIMEHSEKAIANKRIKELTGELLTLHIELRYRPERRDFTKAKIGAIIHTLCQYRESCIADGFQHSLLSLFCLYGTMMTNKDKMRILTLWLEDILPKL